MASVAAPHGTDIPRIGPNTIIQVAAVMRDRLSPSFAEAILLDATPYTMTTMPDDMVDEREAQAVVQALVHRIGARQATSVLREAGSRTADYLLANRIPGAAQLLIRLLPRRLGLRLLLRAMSANAWTFAGSGQFRVVHGRGTPELVFDGCAMCRDMHEDQPMCDFYAGTFERLISVLVAPTVRVVEVECMAHGGAACRFHLEHV
ncbi:MAG: bacteriochlorophyll 4-vinyl reductase [Gemmatimonadaceae bacterium]|nr:bacteriochlorophyll 4-vinyl reductase [Gemmatimonadaceae bacterium]